MKNRITIKSGVDVLNFYLVNKHGSFYLFTQDYTPGVYKYFRDGRSEQEIRSFEKWDDNPRLDKTIERLPGQIDYVMREELAAPRDYRRNKSFRRDRSRPNECRLYDAS